MSSYKNEIQRLCTGDPDFAFEPVIGMRQWSVVDGNEALALRGHFSGTWESGENVAECKASLPVVRATRAFSFYGDLRPHMLFSPIQLIMRQAVSDAHTRVQDDIEFMLDMDNATMSLELNNITVFKGTPLAALRKFLFDANTPPAGLEDDIAYSLRVLDDVTPRTSLDRRPSSFLNDFSSRSWLAEMSEDDALPVTQLRISVGLQSPRREHVPANPACTCGFYAYTHVQPLFDNSTTATYSVFGLIQGYGTVTLGTKGFRAEKARIIALTVPQTCGSEFVDTPWMASSANGGLYMSRAVGMHSFKGVSLPRTFTPAHSDHNLGVEALRNLANDMHVVRDINELVEHARSAYGVDLA